ncbi:MAG TPA: HAMP domain-containing sensor histidine kinase [Eoetvoesiella sp.]
MKFRTPIAQRVVWALTSLVMLAIILMASLVFYVHKKMEDNLINGLVASESKHLDSRLNRLKNKWQEPFEYEVSPVMFAWGEHPSNPAPNMPAALRTLDKGIHTIQTGAGTWHVMVSDSLDGKLYVRYDAAAHEELTRNFSLVLLLIALFFLAASYITGIRVAKWVVLPLQTLTERLTHWAPGSPSVPVPHAHEAGRLLEAFNRVQDQVDDSIAREREFAANLHHEIRTPLSRIRSDSELMLLLSTLGQDELKRLRRIIRSVDDITGSLESTYNIALAEKGPMETVSLFDCVNDAFSRLEIEADNARLELMNNTDNDHNVLLNRYALLTVIRNLIRNAISHAAPATLDVRSIHGGLAFIDSGPGIAAAELPCIFDRYYSSRLIDQTYQNASGSSDNKGKVGLGLAIAQRVCATHGWDITVKSPLDRCGGTAFYLTFLEHKTATAHEHHKQS